MNSSRNLFIVGFSLVFGLAVPYYMEDHMHAIRSGIGVWIIMDCKLAQTYIYRCTSVFEFTNNSYFYLIHISPSIGFQWPLFFVVGVNEIHHIVSVLLSTSMAVGFVVPLILDNTIPGTIEERGLAGWAGGIPRQMNQLTKSTKLLPLKRIICRLVCIASVS